MTFTIDCANLLALVQTNIFTKMAAFIVLILFSLVVVGYYHRLVAWIIIKTFKVENDYHRDGTIMSDNRSMVKNTISLIIAILTYIPFAIGVFKLIFGIDG